MNEKIPLILFALALAAPAIAANYPLGTMTCNDIGAFAQQVVAGQESGKTRETALAELDTRKYGDPVEKKNLIVIVNIMYGGMGQSLTPEAANGIMTSDCEAERPKGN